jgi:nicotinamide riboside transporter PnuC
MNNIQKATIVVGVSGILLNMLCIATHQNQLGYVANFLGRLSGTLYMVAVDRKRLEYFLPLAFAATNAVVASEILLFTELLVSSLVYQVNAYRLFSSLSKK